MTDATTPPLGRRRVLIVEDDTLVGLGLKSELEVLGHEVIAQVATAERAIQAYRALTPDMVLLDIRLDGADGIDLAARLLLERRCPMMIVSAYSEPDLVVRAGVAGVFGYLIKPVTGASLVAQMEIATRRFEEHEKSLHENQELLISLETRKLADRAKGILMKRLNLQEADAHKRLQTESQKRRVSLGDMARRIIESDELLSES